MYVHNYYYGNAFLCDHELEQKEELNIPFPIFLFFFSPPIFVKGCALVPRYINKNRKKRSGGDIFDFVINKVYISHHEKISPLYLF